jgi:arginase family enzyme
MFIVKVPMINGLGKTKGCEKAGNKILNYLKNISSNEQGTIIDTSLLDLEEIHLDNSNLELSNRLIYKNSLKIFETKPKVIFLGGDHSISYSIDKAFLDYCNSEGKQPYLIVFDSHPDCMSPMEEPSHEEWLRKLIETGFPTKNILIVGARNIDKEELIFMKKNDIKVIDMNQLLEDLHEACDFIMEFANKENSELYVSIDVDVLDASVVPGTGYPEVGGLSSRQFIYLIQRIKRVKNLKALDIVEINSERDRDNLTVKLGAKILAELL